MKKIILSIILAIASVYLILYFITPETSFEDDSDTMKILKQIAGTDDLKYNEVNSKFMYKFKIYDYDLDRLLKGKYFKYKVHDEIDLFSHCQNIKSNENRKRYYCFDDKLIYKEQSSLENCETYGIFYCPYRSDDPDLKKVSLRIRKRIFIENLTDECKSKILNEKDPILAEILVGLYRYDYKVVKDVLLDDISCNADMP
ncbi:MAG: hypothetical protein HRT47_14065 [Candidatus Caenarcaniphilales bacterium]|nr:hypothetical protein [Candidatus Caenarcaniphilales bacterium]